MKQLLVILFLSSPLIAMETDSKKVPRKKVNYTKKMYELKKREVEALEKAIELAEIEFALNYSRNGTTNELKACALTELKINQIITNYFKKMHTTSPELFNDITSRLQDHIKTKQNIPSSSEDESDEEDGSDDAGYGDNGESTGP
jgi:hypothetical protein